VQEIERDAINEEGMGSHNADSSCDSDDTVDQALEEAVSGTLIS